MSPTIIVDQEDNVKLILGASGGSKIISSVAQVIVYDLIVNPNKFRFLILKFKGSNQKPLDGVRFEGIS